MKKTDYVRRKKPPPTIFTDEELKRITELRTELCATEFELWHQSATREIAAKNLESFIERLQKFTQQLKES